MLGLEAMTGSLDNFGFEDYLNGKICFELPIVSDVYFFHANNIIYEIVLTISKVILHAHAQHVSV
ncbi:hypothetical protein LINPERPRIM_LOCUS4885 [Linum perenne]